MSTQIDDVHKAFIIDVSSCYKTFQLYNVLFVWKGSKEILYSFMFAIDES